MARSRRRVLPDTVGVGGLLLALLTSTLVALVPTANAAEPSVASFVTMNRPGLSQVWRPGDGLITVTGSATEGVSVDLTWDVPGAGSYRMDFRAPAGERLTPGAYENAAESGTAGPGQPQISLTGFDDTSCERQFGRFTVHDITDDLSRFWLTYERRCPGLDAATFGEVRINVPTQPGLISTASRVEWPADYPGSAREMHLELLNTGTEPIDLSAPEIAGDPDFTVGQDNCATIAAAARCRIALRFTAVQAGDRVATLTLDPSGAAAIEVPLRGRGFPGNTVWQAFGDRGNSMLRGSLSAAPGDGRFYVEGTTEQVRIQVWPANHFQWALTFTAPAGGALSAGTTLRTGPGETGAMSVRSVGRTCTPGPGNFTLHELEFDEVGNVQSVAVTFEDRCLGDTGSLFGTLAIRAVSDPQPLPGFAGRAPGPVFSLKALPAFDEVSLTWGALTPPDHAAMVVRGAEGTVAPATAAAGFAVPFSEVRSTYYVDNTAVAKRLRPGVAHSFSVFVRDEEGLVSPPTSITVGASAVTLKASTRTVRYWDQITFTGMLRSAAGSAVPGQPVEVWCRVPGTTRLFHVGTATTGTGGAYRLTFGPGRIYEYFAFYDGSAAAGLGDVSSGVRVGVAMGVEAADNVGYSVLLGRSFKIGTVVGPSSAGKPVKLQEKIRGKWVTIATKRLRRDNPTVFTVKPTTAGNHKYRVFMPGNRNYADGVSKELKIYVSRT